MSRALVGFLVGALAGLALGYALWELPRNASDGVAAAVSPDPPSHRPEPPPAPAHSDPRHAEPEAAVPDAAPAEAPAEPAPELARTPPLLAAAVEPPAPEPAPALPMPTRPAPIPAPDVARPLLTPLGPGPEPGASTTPRAGRTERIRQGFADARPEFRECYELLLQLEPEASDRLVFTVEVTANPDDPDRGHVDLREIESGNLVVEDLDCFADVAVNLDLEPPSASEGSYVVTYPLIFRNE